MYNYILFNKVAEPPSQGGGLIKTDAKDNYIVFGNTTEQTTEKQSSEFCVKEIGFKMRFRDERVSDIQVLIVILRCMKNNIFD